MTTVIGAVVDGDDVEQAVLTALRGWLPTYVIAQEQRKGMPSGDLPAPRTWMALDQLDSPLQPHQLPAVLVIAAGLDGEPERHEEGRYSATFLISVAIVVSASTYERTRMLARLYAAAIRTSLEQHQPAEDFVIGVEWADEEYDRGPSELSRSMATGYVTFRVFVQGDPGEGPAAPVDPDDDPIPTFPDVPTVDTVEVSLAPQNAEVSVATVSGLLVQVGHGPPSENDTALVYFDEDSGELYIPQ